MNPVLAAGVVLWTGSAAAPQFLLLRNARHGSWGLPKGHAEPGEDLRTTAQREVEEETGYTLAADGLRADFADTHLYQPKPEVWKRVVHFLAAAAVDPQGFVRSPEHDDHAWLPLDQALARCEHDALCRTLRRAATRLASA